MSTFGVEMGLFWGCFFGLWFVRAGVDLLGDFESPNSTLCVFGGLAKDVLGRADQIYATYGLP